MTATSEERYSDPLDALRRPTVVIVRPRKAGTPNRLPPAFAAVGVEGEAASDRALEPREADIVWLWGNARWYPRAARSLLEMPSSLRPKVLLWHREPLPPSTASGLPRPRLHAKEVAKIVLRDVRISDPYSNVRRLVALAGRGLFDVLAVTSEGAKETLAERGVDAAVIPIGSHEEHGRDLGLDRDIDVLFLGALDVPRRKRLLHALRRRGIEAFAVGSWSDPAFWGESRTLLLNRTRILLNLSRYPGQFSGARLLLGMVNGALVVSEPIYRPHPFIPSEHYVSAPVTEMPDIVGHLLAHEPERRAIAERARRFVQHELTMERSLRRFGKLLEERSARGR